MKNLIYTLITGMIIVSCQAPVDNSAQLKYEQNAQTILDYLASYQNESVDHAKFYADSAVIRATYFGAKKDSISLSELIKYDQKSFDGYDWKLVNGPIVLPGVDGQTKLPNGSVRYYGDWKVTKPGTDSTEAKSGVVKGYESFDFNEEGKIVYQQFYGDAGSLFRYLNDTTISL
ncbi:hypothetical protein [Marinoscillum sp. MHG1-6]|uniref:hypothetical protein n=1 Tax=Marinoscillum sp. MHG1-6 TaxID=2959627 RepID=UPI0021571217|nr:hypothetical protein [Marinoscillum sp. MHG1-6]